MIDFLLNFVFINDLTVKGQLWVTEEEVVSLIRCSSLRFVSVKLFFSFKTCFWLFQSGSFLRNLHCLCYFLFLAYFLLLCFSYIEQLKKVYVRDSKTVFSRYKTGLCVLVFCFLKSLNTKKHIPKYKTKCFCKCCFAVLYKPAISSVEEGKGK